MNRLTANTEPSRERWFWIAAGLVVLLAGVLRFAWLTDKPFWMDEIFTTYNTESVPLTDQFLINVFSLFYLVLLKVVMFFRNGEFVYRAVSALSSTAGVAMLIVLVRQLATRRAALLAGLFMALSVLDIYYAQEARPYAPANLLVLLMAWRWAHYLRMPTVVNRNWFLTFAGLGMMTVFSVAFLFGLALLMLLLWPPAQGRQAGFWARVRGNFRHYRLKGTLAFFGGLSLIVFASLFYFGQFVKEVIQVPGYPGVDQIKVVLEISRFMAGDQTVLWALFIVGAAAGAIWLFPRRGRSWMPSMILFYLPVLGGLLTFSFHLLTFKMAVRYLLVVFPFWVALWAIGVDRLLSLVSEAKGAGHGIAVAVVAVIAVFAAPHLQTYFTSPVKWIWTADYHAEHNFVCEHWQDGDAVLGYEWNNFEVLYHFSKPCPETKQKPNRLFVFEEVDFGDNRLNFTRLMDPQDERSTVLWINGETERLTIPYPVKRVWVPIVHTVRSEKSNDLMPWWRRDPNAFASFTLDFPDGSVVVKQDGALLLRLPNPSTDPQVLEVGALMKNFNAIAKELFKKLEESGDVPAAIGM